MCHQGCSFSNKTIALVENNLQRVCKAEDGYESRTKQEKQQSCGNLKSFLIVHLQFSM